ncbi:MAG: SURF1 family protein [Actinomycetota bacterium]|nr:SURF1 family protein [Actinomycetota bacterium]
MYKFLLSPKWIGFHLLCAAAIAGMISLGLWQLRRLDEKQAFNAQVTANTDADVAPLSDVLAVDPDELDGQAYRRIEVTGSYLATPQFEVVNVSQDGLNGRDAVNALQLDDGSLVIVNRGFVAAGSALPAPPTGEVQLLARIKTGQRAGTGQTGDDGSQQLSEIRRVDLEALGQQFDQPLAPVYLELLQSSPAEPSTMQPIAFPELGEGPHLSYAIQWFIFTISVAVGWVFAIRKSVADRTKPKKPSKFKAVERYDPAAS